MNEEHTEILKALSDTTRREILDHLLRVEESSANTICEVFGNLTQPTVSHHLQILRRCHLVVCRKQGKMIYYKLKKESIRLCFKAFIERYEV